MPAAAGALGDRRVSVSMGPKSTGDRARADRDSEDRRRRRRRCRSSTRSRRPAS